MKTTKVSRKKTFTTVINDTDKTNYAGLVGSREDSATVHLVYTSVNANSFRKIN